MNTFFDYLILANCIDLILYYIGISFKQNNITGKFFPEYTLNYYTKNYM